MPAIKRMLRKRPESVVRVMVDEYEVNHLCVLLVSQLLEFMKLFARSL